MPVFSPISERWFFASFFEKRSLKKTYLYPVKMTAQEYISTEYQNRLQYIYTAGNPVMLVDPDGQWVKGAGLFDNIFKSDNRIYTVRTARKHPGAIVARINDNERKDWRVYWMEDDAFIIKDKEHTIRLNTFEFVKFTSPKKTKSKKKGRLFFGSGHDESNSAEKGKQTNTPFELIDPFGVDPIFELSWQRENNIKRLLK